MSLSIENTSRQVIENKLLARLDEPGNVAILASEEDLRIMIQALSQCRMPKAAVMARDYRRLFRAAFPNSKI